MIPSTINYATALVDGQDTGRYTLPEQIVQTVQTYRRATELQAPEVAGFTRQDAADDALAALTAGGPVDLAALAAKVRAGATRHGDSTEASGIALATLELSAAEAVRTAVELADGVVTEHLRSAFDALLEEVRQVAADLDGTSLDLHGLLNAPAKVRKAYERLGELTMRHEALWHARKMCTRLTGARPTHDQSGLFIEFRDRLALHPDLAPTTPVPQLAAPSDPKARLLWLVTDAALGTPWLPTVEEADARWWDQYGQRIQERAMRQEQAQATYGAA
ncbi:hypothetical protein [Phycicoccus avicenniae]|uniref:hypothetical protein n=1 Tax=Phycicoccus avicenniae TaxID=2828860 RepID=UPI003D2C7F4C